MKTEQRQRDTRNDFDDKLINVLEHFLSFHESDEIFTMITDPACDVSDVVEMLENYEDPNYINPNE